MKLLHITANPRLSNLSGYSGAANMLSTVGKPGAVKLLTYPFLGLCACPGCGAARSGRALCAARSGALLSGVHPAAVPAWVGPGSAKRYCAPHRVRDTKSHVVRVMLGGISRDESVLATGASTGHGDMVPPWIDAEPAVLHGDDVAKAG